MSHLNIPLKIFMLYCSSLLLVLFSYFPEKNLALDSHFLNVDIGSLSPASYCTRTGLNTTGKLYSTKLELVHRFGPCSNLDEQKPSLVDILSNDQSRVEAGRNQYRDNKASNVIPSQSGMPLHTGSYIVTVGLGTPPQNVTLELDTGSPLTWTQCQPCAAHCHRQRDPVYNPRSSYTYFSFSCDSSQCYKLNYDRYCYAGPCVYHVFYGDESYSVGILSKDRLTISPTTDDGVFPCFIFGCGQKNIGTTFGQTAGILGLSPDPKNGSFLYQTAQRYGMYFSYCLASTPSLTGHLTLGINNNYPREKLKFTPLKVSQYDYIIEIVMISVGGTQLSISPLVFTNTLSIIDSGTTVTCLPMDAYVALRDAFKHEIGDSYPTAPALRILDTCYDFGNRKEEKKVTVPGISFTFKGGATIDLDFFGIFFLENNGTVGCLAFTGNTDPTDPLVFGNTQQKTLEVVYDVGGQKFGFGPNGCK